MTGFYIPICHDITSVYSCTNSHQSKFRHLPIRSHRDKDAAPRIIIRALRKHLIRFYCIHPASFNLAFHCDRSRIVEVMSSEVPKNIRGNHKDGKEYDRSN